MRVAPEGRSEMNEAKQEPTRSPARSGRPPFSLHLSRCILSSLLLLGLGLSGCLRSTDVRLAVTPAARLAPNDRLLILAPHPGDEALACAGVMQQAKTLHLPLQVVFFTAGDRGACAFASARQPPAQDPATATTDDAARRAAAVAAAALLGLSTNDLTFLGYPDGGAETLWTEHWDKQPPYRDPLTRATRVAEADFRPGAAFTGDDVVRDLTALFRLFLPTRVFVSHPADRHPDHRALYAFARAALWNVEPEDIRPTLHPYLIHYSQWPTRKGRRTPDELTPPATLAALVGWQTWPLAPEQNERKRQALDIYGAREADPARHANVFTRANELFGDYPAIVLSATSGPPSTEKTAVAAPPTADVAPPPPAELAREEQAAFLGLELRSVRLDREDVELTLYSARPLAGSAKLSVYCCGYRRNKAFAAMPKVHVRIGVNHYECFDQTRRLSMKAVTLERQDRTLTLRLPLALLDHPRRLVIGARISQGETPLDWLPWRIVEWP